MNISFGMSIVPYCTALKPEISFSLMKKKTYLSNHSSGILMEIAPLYPITLSLSEIPAVVGFTITPMSPGKVRTQINNQSSGFVIMNVQNHHSSESETDPLR